MMFQRTIVKLLLRENARLRREIKRKDDLVAELLDKFIHNKVPNRIVAERSAATGGMTDLSAMSASLPSDAYSQAIEDAERLARAASYGGYEEVDEDQDA